MIFASFDKCSPSCFEAPWQIAAAPVIRAESSGAAMLIVKCRVAVIMWWPTVALRLYFEVRQNIAKPDPSPNTNTLFIIVLWSLDSREKQNTNITSAMLRTIPSGEDSMPTGPSSQQNVIGEKMLEIHKPHLLLFCTVSKRSPEPGIVRESQYLQTHLDIILFSASEWDIEIITRLSNIPHVQPPHDNQVRALSRLWFENSPPSFVSGDHKAKIIWVCLYNQSQNDL